jgi:HSP20 family molecular chaperone IbpA
MADLRNRMWAEAIQLLNEAERMHRSLFTPRAGSRQAVCWEPPVDLIETADEIWISVALPGVAADRLQVGTEGESIVVAGDRPLALPRGSGVIRRLEIPHGRFERRIGLPPGRFELRGRELADGCLTIVLRRLA